MQLKRLQLSGFKTFADKTEIEFSHDVTAVVGPNGCGKSNLSDALLWVLGEQNPRILRGAEGRDVIFNGTDRRKPVGMAEVKLTVDNADRSLPTPFTEVVIGRRVYRSGESAYTLNGAACRLKDIVELFLDTGAGKGAYAFVGQSEVDAVLSARPEDRRELFEEAAGIKKYRVKKREAVRKLENAEANLQRIRDITAELDAQRAPMAQQAELARRYRFLTQRLEQIEVDLLVSELQKADYELYAARQTVAMNRTQIAELEAGMAEVEKTTEELGHQLAQAEGELEGARAAVQAAGSFVERTQGRLQLLEERRRGSSESVAVLETEIAELQQRLASAQTRSQQTVSALAAAEAEALNIRNRLAEAKSAMDAAERELTQARAAAADRQGSLVRIAEERAQHEATLRVAHARRDELTTRLQSLEAERSAAADAETRARELEQQLVSRMQHSTQQLETLSQQLSALQAQRTAAENELTVLQADSQASAKRLAELTSRLRTLEELHQGGEGFHHGVRAVLQASRKGTLHGNFQPLVDLLAVPENLRTAVDVAMGASLQDIVCDTEEEAKAAIAWLKQTRSGRATFLALTLVRPGRTLSKPDLLGLRGLLGVASELVSAEDRFRPVLMMALGRVVIAEDLDAAIAASRRLQGWSRIVTLEGELLTPGGAMTGGSMQGRAGQLVGRKGEIDDLKKQIPLLQKQASELTNALQRAGENLRGADAAVGEAQVKVSAARSEKAVCERDLAAAQRDTARALETAERTAKLCGQVQVELEAVSVRISELTAASAVGSSPETGEDDILHSLQAQAQAAAEMRDAARTVHLDLEILNGRMAEKLAGLRREKAAAETQAAEIESTLHQRLRRRAEGDRVQEDTDRAKAELEVQLYEAEARLAALTETLEQHSERRRALLQQNLEISNRLREMSRQRTELQQDTHETELLHARLEVKLSQFAARLQDEYGIDREQALARTDVTEPGRDTVNEVARLRREIRAMGPVNIGAVEEFDRLSERYDFLSGQQADLEKAREALLTTIREIDDSTRGVFNDTFHAVRAEFDRLFVRMFGGGSAQLRLTNPEDLLETGIEILAQPPGKKPQHLSLLSGGERALTAVALLFAFLSVKPSPFVILDEVDAPLDGANVEKFANLLKDFAERTQFIVITHNPTTMEAAPRWYGVTMQEAGVSRVVSYRVPREAAAGASETMPDEIVPMRA